MTTSTRITQDFDQTARHNLTQAIADLIDMRYSAEDRVAIVARSLDVLPSQLREMSPNLYAMAGGAVAVSP